MRVCVCVCARARVCVCVCGGGGGGKDVITIQTSTMSPLSATVSHVPTGVCGWGSDYKCISLSQRARVGICVR